MPIYDKRCNVCGHTVLDTYESVHAPKISCPQRTPFEFYNDEDGHPIEGSIACEGTLERVWLGHASNVIGDECDVWVRHGICNEDGTPRHYRFKSEMRAEAKRRGLVSHVEHIPQRGSDKSPHTSRWV